VQDLYLEATQAIDQGDEKKARESLEHLLALQPEHVNASIAMAKICRKARNFEEALSVLEAALKAEPANLSLLYEKAVTQFEQGEPAAALTTLDGMLKPEIRMPSGRYLRAVILASTKDREGALAALEDALENGFDDLQRLEKEGRLTFIAQEERYFRVAERLRTRAHSAAQASGSGAERQKDDLELKLLREARESPQKSELLPRLERNLSSGQGTRIAVDLKAVDEQQLQLSSYAGKPVVIVLWGTWSGWCRKQLSEVARLRDAFQPRGLAVLSLYYELMGKRKEDIEEGVRTYLRDAKIDLPCAVIDDGFANSIEVATYPTTIFVASDGKAYLKAAGFMDYATLEALATALMKGPSPPAASPKDR
jgi:tetratricopeptide (TPR) repeat protein